MAQTGGEAAICAGHVGLLQRAATDTLQLHRVEPPDGVESLQARGLWAAIEGAKDLDDDYGYRKPWS